MMTNSSDTASFDNNNPDLPSKQRETQNNHEEVNEQYLAHISLYYVVLQTCDVRLDYCTEITSKPVDDHINDDIGESKFREISKKI
jgi:hypothetical protein